MKNKQLISIIAIVACLVVGIVAVSLLYKQLSKLFDTAGNRMVQESQEQETSEQNAEGEVEVTYDPAKTTQEDVGSSNGYTDFAFTDMDGNAYALSDFIGDRPLVVNMWATWCPPCREELPYFEEAYVQYEDSVNFLMINLDDDGADTVSSVREFLEENGYGFPVYLDPEAAGLLAYGYNAIPVTLFIDADGNVTLEQLGGMTRDYLMSKIEGLVE